MAFPNVQLFEWKAIHFSETNECTALQTAEDSKT